ncbi:MAG: hypothetical protein HY329_27100 [Chloroflexi bacterium]|nr:hypothetical protein [Chloroflexota bacterium]
MATRNRRAGTRPRHPESVDDRPTSEPRGWSSLVRSPVLFGLIGLIALLWLVTTTVAESRYGAAELRPTGSALASTSGGDSSSRKQGTGTSSESVAPARSGSDDRDDQGSGYGSPADERGIASRAFRHALRLMWIID